MQNIANDNRSIHSISYESHAFTQLKSTLEFCDIIKIMRHYLTTPDNGTHRKATLGLPVTSSIIIIRAMKPRTESLPNSATVAAIAAVLLADEGLSDKHRDRVLAVLRAPGGQPERSAGWMPASLCAVRLGVHLSTLVRWADSGRVKSRRTPGDRALLVNLDECQRYAAAHPNAKRGTPPRTPDPASTPPTSTTSTTATLPGME